jgi:hypothetical protein
MGGGRYVAFDIDHNNCHRVNEIFMFQARRTTVITFSPVIETQVGADDEAFISDYPMKILLSGDMEFVPWMVGVTSREGGLFPICETEFDIKLADYPALPGY